MQPDYGATKTSDTSSPLQVPLLGHRSGASVGAVFPASASQQRHTGGRQQLACFNKRQTPLCFHPKLHSLLKSPRIASSRTLKELQHSFRDLSIPDSNGIMLCHSGTIKSQSSSLVASLHLSHRLSLYNGCFKHL